MTRARAVCAALAALVAAYALLRALATPPEPAATLARPAVGPVPAPPTVPSEADLRAALVALDTTRAAGYADPAAADPDAWSTRGCACRREDVRRLRRLAARGLALRGHRVELLASAVVRADPGRATLAVTDRTTAYAAVDARGRTVARWPASPPRRWRITLVRDAGRWLVGRITRAPPPRGVAIGPRG